MVICQCWASKGFYEREDKYAPVMSFDNLLLN